MRHERLAQLMHTQPKAMAADPAARFIQKIMLGILSALDKGEATEGLALRILRSEALRLADEPAHTTLYCQAALDIRQIHARSSAMSEQERHIITTKIPSGWRIEGNNDAWRHLITALTAAIDREVADGRTLGEQAQIWRALRYALGRATQSEGFSAHHSSP